MDDSAPSILLPAMLVCSTLIDEDVLVEILKRLPTKTLCRFLCVCKEWKSLISSSLFITLRNSFTHSSTPPKLKPYIQVRDNSYVLCVANHHDLKHEELHFPFRSTNKSGGGGINFVDVIHGVVCLSYSSESGFDSTILWNPAIHKYVSLPRLPFPANRAKFDVSVIGFGFDTSNNDFKVVRIWMPDAASVESMLPRYEVVYVTLEGGIRSRVATMPYIFKRFHLYQDSRTSCFVNGNIHWIVYAPDGGRLVLMFDCKREYFRIVNLPRGIFFLMSRPPLGKNKEAPQKSRIMEYAGMLSVVVDWCLDLPSTTTSTDDTRCSLEDRRLFHTELWVMEEHGVADTWTKLYRFRNSMSGLYFRFDICRDSFVDLAPYGPQQWSDFTLALEKSKHRRHSGVQSVYDVYEYKYDEIVSGHVYEESMFLMDHPKAHSYSDEDQEEIVCKEIKTVADATSGPWWCAMVFNYGTGRPVQRVSTRRIMGAPHIRRVFNTRAKHGLFT